jgi:hypothetical protein
VKMKSREIGLGFHQGDSPECEMANAAEAG